MDNRTAVRTVHLLFLVLLVALEARGGARADDVDALLRFKSTLTDGGGDVALRDWVAGTQPCRGNTAAWTGVLCDGGGVLGLQLENMSLSGTLNIDTIVGLSTLRTLSFMNNSFEGLIPDITKIPALRSIYLSMNRFSGEIPDGMFAKFQRMKKVYLSGNRFSGKIPSSLVKVAWLMELRLDGNEFVGGIPDFRQQGLTLVNVSYNKLEGPIPGALKRMDASLFAGNANLCGAPLSAPCTPPSAKRSPTVPLILVIFLSIALLILIISLLIFVVTSVRRRRNQAIPTTRPHDTDKGKKPEHSEAKEKKAEHGGDAERRRGGGGKKASKEEKAGGKLKLTFVKESRNKFNLEDLLRASAEVLGSGNFGSSYKATLFGGPAVVVKRFKEMTGVAREDFQEHMRRLGRLSHPNLLPLVAYYYRKDEKLLVTDYVANGSLAHMLHGNRGTIESPLDWATRLKIVKGIARGLEYLSAELPMLLVPHGHLKSSNVLLDFSYGSILMDYALLPLMNQSHAAQVMVAYKSPECASGGRPSGKSDVWSLGILILEILTGKFPATNLRQGKTSTDLAGWVSSIASEERDGGKVFDGNMKGTDGAEGEMLKLLHIGVACCEADVAKRWEMNVALEKIEALKERDGDGGLPSVLSGNAAMDVDR